MEGECSKAVQGGNAEHKEGQRKMEEDPPITVAFVFSAVQSRREPMSPKRNLNLKPETRRTIFTPTIFTKPFNNKKKEVEGICALFLIRYTSCQTNIDLNRIYISL